MASRIAMKHPYGQWRFHIWKKRVGGVPAKPGNRRTEVSVEQWYILGQGMAGHPVAEAEAETKLHWCLNWSGNPQMMADFTETQASHMPHEHWSSFHKHAYALEGQWQWIHGLKMLLESEKGGNPTGPASHDRLDHETGKQSTGSWSVSKVSCVSPINSLALSVLPDRKLQANRAKIRRNRAATTSMDAMLPGQTCQNLCRNSV
jgi:hypothetical protein